MKSGSLYNVKIPRFALRSEAVADALGRAYLGFGQDVPGQVCTLCVCAVFLAYWVWVQCDAHPYILA